MKLPHTPWRNLLSRPIHHPSQVAHPTDGTVGTEESDAALDAFVEACQGYGFDCKELHARQAAGVPAMPGRHAEKALISRQVACTGVSLSAPQTRSPVTRHILAS